MKVTKYIHASEREQNFDLINRTSEIIFGTEEAAEFIERYVPERGRVPLPKVLNFSRFLFHVPKNRIYLFPANEL